MFAGRQAGRQAAICSARLALGAATSSNTHHPPVVLGLTAAAGQIRRIKPAPARLAQRALRGLHGARQRAAAAAAGHGEPQPRRLRLRLSRDQRHVFAGAGRARERGRLPPGDAQQEVRACGRAEDCLPACLPSTGDGAADYRNRGQYSDAVLNELESQNDQHVEGIMGKVKILKDVRVSWRGGRGGDSGGSSGGGGGGDGGGGSGGGGGGVLCAVCLC